MVTIGLGCPIGQPPSGRAASGLLACYALARDPKIDDVSHLPRPPLAECCLPDHKRANCADTVALVGVARSSPLPKCGGRGGQATHGSVNEACFRRRSV